MDALSSTATDVICAYPVVLAAIEDIAHLVCSDGVHVFIIATNFFPLEDRQQTKWLRKWHTTNVQKTQILCAHSNKRVSVLNSQRLEGGQICLDLSLLFIFVMASMQSILFFLKKSIASSILFQCLNSCLLCDEFTGIDVPYSGFRQK